MSAESLFSEGNFNIQVLIVFGVPWWRRGLRIWCCHCCGRGSIPGPGNFPMLPKKKVLTSNQTVSFKTVQNCVLSLNYRAQLSGQSHPHPLLLPLGEGAELIRSKFPVAQRVTNRTRIHEAVGPIPGLAQWVKDPVLP